MNFPLIFLVLLLLPLPALAAAGEGPLPAGRDITVMADPSLTVPLSLIARTYSREEGIPVTSAFASTREQLDRMGQGIESADLFIAAKPGWIKELQQKGLIDVYSRSVIARNRMAIVAPRRYYLLEAKAGEGWLSLLPLHEEEFQFAIGDPQYLAEGSYALEALMGSGLGRELEPFYSVFHNIFSLIRVVSQHGAFGVVFYSDAQLYPDLQLVTVLPPTTHSPVVYQAAVIAGDNMDSARGFLAYLQSPRAAKIFRRHGFDPVQ